MRLRLECASRYLSLLNEGKMISTLERSDEEKDATENLICLTSKPMLYVYNVSEDQVDKGYMEISDYDLPEGVVISVKSGI